MCGGPTPRYLEGLVPVRKTVRQAVLSGVPYLGFSAGAMVASEAALVGGWRHAGRPVCPEEWSEGHIDVTVRPGLGLVPFSVDVHVAQAGLLGRTLCLPTVGGAAEAVGIDEDTCLAVPPDGAAPWTVSGSGKVWRVVGDGGSEARVEPAGSTRVSAIEVRSALLP
ncbi:MAG TPA: hypothetical protein VLB03_10410 [Nocardioidaceae bacterium]|nr:hypothetical protein [Nocardioidaceae bacterium]